MNAKRARYKQYDFHLDELDDLNLDWTLEKYGCGPTSIANVLANYGFNVTPTDMARKILFDKNGNFDDTYLRKNGISKEGIIYCLERLINEDKYLIAYEIVKIDFSDLISQKEKVEDLIRKGCMAIIHVGPSEDSPLTFSKSGHYLVISDVDKDNNFYVINSNRIGDKQLGVPFDYETIAKNMEGRKDSFNFLFIKIVDKVDISGGK